MNKPPAFQFYPKDFLTDDKVAVMNLEEKGAYIVLLSYCWNNNGLTKNQNELKNMCGNPRNWDRIWGKVGKCFYEKKGKYFNKRLEKEYKKQKEWRKKSQKGGIQSGISRGGKPEPEVKGGSTKEQPNTNSSVCSLQSSSLSSNNIKEEEKNISPEPKITFCFTTESWLHIQDKDIQRWKDTYPACNIEYEIKKMADWLLANPSKKKKNYKSFISRWLTKTQDKGGSKGVTEKDKSGWAERYAKKIEGKE